jgi:hypothetical protein
VKSTFLTGTLFLCPLLALGLAAQTPTEQAPAQTAPAPTAQAAASQAAAAPTPAPPKQEITAAPAPRPRAGLGYPELESYWSFSASYWRPYGSPILRGGQASVDPAAQNLDFLGNPQQAPGITITIPTGHSNRLEISGWQTQATQAFTAPADVTYFGQTFNQGDLLSAHYRIRNISANWNYLTYPYPPLDSKFRIKTLWGIQYVQAAPTITGPQPGDTTPPPLGVGKVSLILPTFGIGMEYIVSPKHLRLEWRGSGMGLPNHSAVWDAEGLVVARAGNLEIFGGAKAFYFRTSPQKEQFVSDRFWGPTVGVRWVFRQSSGLN